MRKGRRQKLKNGYEEDLVYAKNIYCYLQKPKTPKLIKRAMNKRARKEFKASTPPL